MTIIAVLGLAVLDSVNPSALLVTIYLLTHRSPIHLIGTYLATVFLVYLSIGVALMLGFDMLWNTLSEWLESSTVYAAQGVLGAALLAYAILTPSSSKKEARAATPRSIQAPAIVVLGATVTLLELPTALPYLAAIGIMTTAELANSEWFILLLVYNLIFILPPVILVALFQVSQRFLEARIGTWRQRLSGYARETWLWIIGIVGFFLLADALVFFDIFGWGMSGVSD